MGSGRGIPPGRWGRPSAHDTSAGHAGVSSHAHEVGDTEGEPFARSHSNEARAEEPTPHRPEHSPPPMLETGGRLSSTQWVRSRSWCLTRQEGQGWGQRQVLTPARPLPVCGLVGWEGVPAAPWVCFPRESGRVARAPSPGSVRLSPHPPALAPGTGSALPRGGLQRALRSPGWAGGGTAGLGAGRGWAGGGAGAGPSPTCPLSLRSPLKLFQKDVEVQALLGVQESDLERTQPGVWHPEEARSPAPVGAPSPGPAPPPWAPSWRGQLRAPWASPRGRRRAARCWRSPAPPPRGPGRSATPTWSCALRVRASGSCRPWGLRGRWPGGGSPLAASKQFVPAWITRGPG